jgi:WD40 repeat protein
MRPDSGLMTQQSQPAPRPAAALAAGLGLLAWVALAAGPSATADTAGDPAEAATEAAAAPAASDAELLAAALALRAAQPALFNDAAGVLVLEALPGTQAAAVELRRGDILLRYAGAALDTPDGLGAATRRAPAGTPVVLELLRDGAPHRVELAPGPIGISIIAVAEPDPAAGADALYAQPVLVIDPGMHTAPIIRADVDAAGRLAVTGSIDKTVRLWALDGDPGGPLSEPLATWRLPAGPGAVGKVYAVAMAPAGDLIAAGGWTRVFGNQQIYLFNRDGRLAKRIDGLPDGVAHLAFSSDGRWLAAGLGGANGIRVYDRRLDWAEAARDADYGGDVYGLAFAADGRLATTSLDGQVRLYDARFGGDPRPIARQPMTAGERPYGIAFHPDGERLAVGFGDRPAVVLLDGRTMAPPARQLGPAGLNNRDLAIVAWSRDGATLYAAGSYADYGQVPRSVLAWSDAGTGPRRVHHRGPLNSVVSMHPLADGGLLVAAGDPYLAVLGAAPAVRPSPLLDPRDQLLNLAVSADGAQVDFGFEYGGAEDRHRFDLAGLIDPAAPALAPLPAADGRTRPPRQTGLAVEDWINNRRPTLAGTPLPLKPYETARSLAIHPDGQRFVLGTEWYLRAFDAAGAPLWSGDVPGAAWAVNISGDGRLVVVAYADGTIRWQRMDDGRELLALLPMADRRNWVAWTPEGIYAATPGAQGVLRWHVNRGWDRLAEAVPVSEIPEQRRPDVLPLVLQEQDVVTALGLAELAKIRGAIARRLPTDVAPGAWLHVLAIGVGDYDADTAAHLRLEFADDDAHDLAAALLNTQGTLYAAVKPQLLRNQEATGAGVLRALDGLKAQMQPGRDDLAVIHFSGHAALVDGRLFLLPHDTDATDKVGIKRSGIEVASLRADLAALAERGRVLVLLDACHSGGATEGALDLGVDAALLRGALAMGNVTVLTSSAGTETSREDPRWRNGAFTEALLEALGRAADTDKNGLVSMDELTGYLTRRVPQLTDGRQTPGVEMRFTRTVFAAGL